MGVSFVPMSEWFTLLAQVDPPENLPQRLLTDFTIQKILRAVLAIAIAYGTMALIQGTINWLSERVPRRLRLLIKQSIPFWKGLILILILAYLLNLFFNLSQNNLIALTGTIAVALGFAFKDYVSSIIAGAVALFEAPYRVGDRIKIGEHYGEVVGYGLRGIQLQTPDDNLVTIPHNKTWTEAVSNANSGQLEAQVATDFFFGHGVDVEQVIQILYQAAYSSKYTQLKLPIVVVMQEKMWGTQFKLRCYPMDARDEFIYKTDLIRRAKQAFAHQGLPYPRLVPQTVDAEE
ncbi:Small-conductance mechanosensitive channel [Picosynechococcus sp. OG1]|uniref:mechanosensitive ion channel family protein n=2 Tax=Cyanophyceae TaxID=3028117 RepID=UPI00016DCDDC|nr:mechanosensitive ion channel family protein [Picosynechococcus sp. PCC 7002]ACB00551.1 small-conductance mechanosensitive channel [Picosynechococcus sp. PCC 7002]SMH50269.1 Small-conductance mechanosensitive channel [Picosynechococcus sp. OG1]SMQ81788.1 Small-conductance mechanosensitive channel [Synechococcus sp. 7002]